MTTYSAFSDVATDNEILQELAETLASELFDDLLEVFPGAYVSPFKEDDDLAWLSVIAAMPGIEADVPFLMDPRIEEKMKTGMAPSFETEYWKALAAVPPIFKEEVARFQRVFGKQLRESDKQPQIEAPRQQTETRQPEAAAY